MECANVMYVHYCASNTQGPLSWMRVGVWELSYMWGTVACAAIHPTHTTHTETHTHTPTPTPPDIVLMARLDPSRTGVVEASQLYATYLELTTWLRQHGQATGLKDVADMEEMVQVGERWGVLVVVDWGECAVLRVANMEEMVQARGGSE